MHQSSLLEQQLQNPNPANEEHPNSKTVFRLGISSKLETSHELHVTIDEDDKQEIESSIATTNSDFNFVAEKSVNRKDQSPQKSLDSSMVNELSLNKENSNEEQEQIFSDDKQLQSVASLLNLIGEDAKSDKGAEDQHDQSFQQESDSQVKHTKAQSKSFRQLRMKMEDEGDGSGEL